MDNPNLFHKNVVNIYYIFTNNSKTFPFQLYVTIITKKDENSKFICKKNRKLIKKPPSSEGGLLL